jgi:hypothetical protein
MMLLPWDSFAASMKSLKSICGFLKHEELYTLEREISNYKVDVFQELCLAKKKLCTTERLLYDGLFRKEVHSKRMDLNINRGSN